MSVITVAIEILFAFLFIATLISYIRARDALSRDVMLIFASVAALFGVLGLSAVAGRLPDPVLGAAVAILLAQPLFTLRLAHQLRPVPRTVWAVAGVAFVITAVPSILLPLDRITPLFLAAALVFSITHLTAAIYLAREARRRVGSASVRLGSAAAASVAMALALGLSTFGSQLPFGSDLGRILALGAATLYVLAFMPPAWVRKVWGAVATYEFTDELMDAPAAEDVAAVWSRAAELARRTSGALAAIVVGGDPVRTLTIARDVEASGPPDLPPFTSVPAPRVDDRPLGSTDGELAAVARSFGVRYASVLHFGRVDGDPGALVLIRARPSLFAADDHRIVSSVIGRAAVFAERREALADEAALAQRLAVTVRALEQASQAKSDFVASMSHELRTPLSAIIGFSALMRDEPLEGDRRSVPDEWVQHMHRSGDHLLALINDVLDLTKIEAGRIQLEPEPFDLGAALGESVEGLRPLAEKKHIKMVMDLQAGSIRADRGRLRQIVYNLLSNAIKFTPDGGRICVEARWDGDDARISVSDTGVGVAPVDLDRIFEKFSQVGDMKAREAGTGLGLALSRRLAQAHGGEISVSSEVGVGSRFELVLPGARLPAGDVAEDRGVARVLGPPESAILIIEDDPGAVRLLRTYLEAAGYAVVVATDGEAGIAAARSMDPAAIILDVLLPGIDGWEVLRRLKAGTGLRDIPVIVVTVVDERNVAMSLGAADYFLKPVHPEALLERLSAYDLRTRVPA